MSNEPPKETKHSDHYNPEVWVQPVGRLMIAFGSIESSVNGLLAVWLESERGTRWAIGATELRDRIDFIRKCAPIGELGEENRDALNFNLKRVIQLAEVRNVIAHSPLVLSMHKDDPNGRWQAGQMSITSEKERGRSIGYQELCDAAEEATLLASVVTDNMIGAQRFYSSRRFPDGEPFNPAFEKHKFKAS